jgi:Tol biopolymer transport system component
MEVTNMRTAAAVILVTAILAGVWPAAQQRRQQDIDLQAAIRTETIDGDLTKAIKQYEAITTKYKEDRAIAATALVHMADCYQKLGDAEAQKIFERIVHQYADQKEAAATARARLSAGFTARTAGPATRRVWVMPRRGEIFGGTVSPDGRYIPYIDWAPEHHGDLFLHDLRTGMDRRLTDTAGPGSPSPDDQFAEEASFSRDGKQLAYTWFNGKKDRYEIRLVNLQGTGIPQFRRVFDNEDVFWIAPYDWSPDGNWLAVSVHRKDRTAQIGLVAVHSGVLRVLKSVDWRGPSRMAFSADGKFLAYDLPRNDTSDQRDIFVLATDGSRERPAAVHPANDLLIGWLPDGKRLLFTSDRSGAPGLWALSFVDGNPVGTPESLKRDIGQFSALGVSTSGALFSSAGDLGSDIQIASLDFTTGEFLRPPVTAVQTFVGSNRFPDWSPDGKYLAYVSWRGVPADRFVIGIRSVETGDVRELSPPLTGLGVNGGVRWSRDGRSFLAVGQDVKGRNGIFRIDAQTGDTTILVVRDRAGITMPLQSQDGTRVYYSVAGAVLMQRDLTSGDEIELVRPPTALTAMSLSPDGRYIAATSTDPSSKANTLLLVHTSNGKTEELMRRPEGQRPVVYTWAPDSRSILVRMVSNEGRFEIWRVSLDGSQPVKLDARLDAKIRTVRLHPDGRQIAFQIDEPPKPTEVWVTENLLPMSKSGR